MWPHLFEILDSLDPSHPHPRIFIKIIFVLLPTFNLYHLFHQWNNNALGSWLQQKMKKLLSNLYSSIESKMFKKFALENKFLVSKGPTIVCSDCLDTISYRPIEAGEKMSIYFKQAYFGVIFMLWFFSNWWKKVTTFSHL